ncbi:MAG: YbhB/YbcL family Raf kinase inhibitor-like protein [Rhodospirillales bacterium]
MAMVLFSSAFSDGERIPVRFTCDGENISPPLEWRGSPETARSFALLCSDPDAPGGTWYHWAVFDIPPDTTHLAEALPPDARVGPFRQAVTDFGRPGYGGPCPPRGHGSHHYRFRLIALDVAVLPVAEPGACRDVERLAEAHRLEEATVVGTYSR